MKFDFKKFATLVSQLGPIILPAAGVPPALTGLIIHGITVAEQIPGASGSEKKAHVTELVKTGAEGVNAATGHPTVDAAQVSGAVSQGIDAVITTVKTIQNIPVKDAPLAAGAGTTG